MRYITNETVRKPPTLTPKTWLSMTEEEKLAWLREKRERPPEKQPTIKKQGPTVKRQKTDDDYF